MSKKRMSARFTFAELCKAFDLEWHVDKAMDELVSQNDEWLGREWCAARARFIEVGFSEEAANEAASAAIQQLEDKIHLAYIHAAVAVLTREAGLRLNLHIFKVERLRKETMYEVTPVSDWTASAEEIRLIIDGEGIFDVSTMKMFLQSGPYTPRQAVLSHLHYLSVWYEVFGQRSLKERFEQELADNLSRL